MNGLPRPDLASLSTLGAVTLCLGLLAGCSSNDTAADRSPADSSTTKHHAGKHHTKKPTETTSDSDPTGADDQSTDADSSSSSSKKVTVPVYFVGDTPQGPRL